MMMRLMMKRRSSSLSFLVNSKHVGVEEDIRSPKLQEAMNEELMTIEKNNTQQVTDLPKGHKANDVK